jgi:hypothetical protein
MLRLPCCSPFAIDNDHNPLENSAAAFLGESSPALTCLLFVWCLRRFQKPLFEQSQFAVFRCSLASAHLKNYFVSLDLLDSLHRLPRAGFYLDRVGVKRLKIQAG